MKKGKKVFNGFLIVGLCLLLLVIGAMLFIGDWLNPNPEKVLSRMERRDPQRAQEILDCYAGDLEQIAAATEFLELGERYGYSLNVSSTYYEKQLQEMPSELSEALRQMEQKFPECEESLELCQGQIGVWITNDGGGFSFLCYPGDKLIRGSVFFDDGNGRGVRRHDMGGGWELQMYYAPKG